MIQACFSHPSSPAAAAAAASQSPQSLITSIYQTHLLDSPTHLTLTWSRTASSHMLTIHSSPPHLFSLTISLQPPTFSLFRTRPGSKSIHLTPHRRHVKIKVHWDFTRAEFARGSAEPEARFYLSLTCNGKLEFYLGDLEAEAGRRHRLASARQLAEPTTTLLSRREHVFGSRVYACTAQFLGSKHEIAIECSGGVLKVKVDGETRLVVKRLAWKFRGNERITVGATEVDFFWDVLNWVGNITGGEIGNCGYGVFVFQVGECGVIWPEMVGPEKKLMKKSKSALVNPAKSQKPATLSPSSPSCSSVLQWAEESGSSDGSSRSSCCSSSTRSSGSGNGGFSLMVYAWRSE
ncbi:uncharacterized protein LOC115734364 [Rhodamnia argentea]|uniref:Uncharacterized protein LOC115734364 n=1 Tax=Rhodamnia argentea TaxID=178133 RepID=A0A8B8NET5_9MYRT|nr:uncharacterized protein LOC115734364 [Rhodamnia argentea]